MEVFHLTRKKYGISLSPAGAAIRGGRWNSRSTEIIYTSSSRALAMAEVAVYLSMDMLPDDYVMLRVHIPESIGISSVDTSRLPSNWNSFPHFHHTQEVGNQFVVERKSCILKVPSAVVPGDYNYLINPSHPDFEKIAVLDHHDFPFNPRLF